MARSSPIAVGLARAWFPLALVLLLLLAVPGVVLFVLTLLGRETEVNPWLQEHWRISYHLPIPWWAGLVLLLVPLFILLLYFLKLKRKPLHVPSTFLWKKSIEDLHVNSLLQWLRENVLLLLQILTVLMLLYAVMSIRRHGNLAEGRRYILMIDNSASMSATDVSPTRLEVAKSEALKEIDAHTDADSGMLIVFNSSAESVVSYTHDRGELRRRVQEVQPTQRPTRLEEALALAAGLANPARSTDDVASRPAGEDPSKARTYVATEGQPAEVFLYSDGRFSDVKDFDLGNLSVQYRAIGSEESAGSDNVGLVTLNASSDVGYGMKLTSDSFNALRNAAVPEAALKKLDPLRNKQFRSSQELKNELARLLTADERKQHEPTIVDQASQSAIRVFAEVANYRSQSADIRIDLEVYVNGELKKIVAPQRIDGRGTDDQPRTIAGRKFVAIEEGKDDSPKREVVGRGTFTFLIDGLGRTNNVVLHAKLRDHHDRLPLDDESWLVVGAVRRARILIVTPGNEPLTAFFNHPATQTVVATTYLEPEALSDPQKYVQPARDGAWDLVIFDRCAPAREEDQPAANTWYIDNVPPRWKRADIVKDQANILDHPPIRGWNDKSPLMRDLPGLNLIGIDSAFYFDLTSEELRGTPRLLESSGNRALLFALNREWYTDVVQTFPIIADGKFNTSWPLLGSFPLFLYNMTYSLGNVEDAAAEERVQPGDVKTLRPDKSVKTIQVVAPDPRSDGLPRVADNGTEYNRERRPDFAFGDTERAGVYAVRWDSQVQRYFAVNLLDVEESNIEPRREIRIGGETIQATRASDAPVDTWKWIALGALGLLLLEWYIYNRRVFI